MKITVWVQGSGLPLEYQVPDQDEIDWRDFIRAIHNGSFANEFLLFDDVDIEHYIRVSCIDVIKVES